MTINNLNKKYYIAAYGSLRKGCYNYTAFLRFFGSSNFRWIKEMKIKGFQLYSLGVYPAVKIGTPEDELTIDIIQVSQAAYDRILGMERGAGYEELSLVIPPFNEDITIFIYTEIVYQVMRVKDGDWSKHISAVEGEKRNIFERASSN